MFIKREGEPALHQQWLRMIQTHTHTKTDLQYLAAIRSAVYVFARLVHPQGDAVEQDDHDADPLKPCMDSYSQGIHSGTRTDTHTHIHTLGPAQTHKQTPTGTRTSINTQLRK